ncbi:RagB/SusD family nutrient uptake outer membrane protein [Cellulophaga sp. 20_2_10]|uniref:RagB/SusD family nutrient uptake outer membrane protein n=1 Tax=Cellulophaga sp. 20_2_10 TaxID=2942476 RepID=UPI00201A57F7|nr:RagB/SusD family nutrient uptake outer membrane protein [Cellulophaga sp. 20_2_10]MCL5247207.1 RagB/SusD family nutrient uptake outer membrane protein [Cellulophaga sp. 20_2_10]
MKNHIIYTIVLLLGLTSCNEYLDVEPIGKLIPEKIEDFDRLLVGGAYSIHSTSDEEILFISADDAEPIISFLGDITSPENLPIRYLKWEADLFPINSQVNLWNRSYENIYTYNFIVKGIDKATGKDSQAKKEIKAEARTMRSYEYFILVNAFAKQYTKSTANIDLGVPVVTIPDVLAESKQRSTLQETYDFILKDLNESVNDLPIDPKGITRAGRAAGYGLLARVYLQMGDYEKARENANLALEVHGDLADYTTNENLGVLYNSEQYVNRYFSGSYGYTGGSMTQETQALYDLDNDIRVNGIWALSWRGLMQKSYSTLSNHCVSVSEMYVIRAECNARLLDASVSDVLDDLNELRRNRIVDYVDIEGVTTKEQALTFVLEERRREMMSTGVRWFDLKRLNLESGYAKTITHNLEEEEYILQPNSSRYVFPIPPETMNFNPNMKQNIRE